MNAKKLSTICSSINTEYLPALKEARAYVTGWRNEMKDLEYLCEKLTDLKRNVAAEVILGIALEDCLFDLETEEDASFGIVLNCLSKKVNDYVLTCGADERNISQSARMALYNLCKSGKAGLITAYLDKMIEDIDEFLKVLNSNARQKGSE